MYSATAVLRTFALMLERLFYMKMFEGSVSVSREIGGRTLTLESGKIAKQASGAVIITYGESSVLCACVRANPREGLDFFPLTVDYRERAAAAGKFPGGFRKREGAPNEREILTMRMIDRPIRPLFPDGYIDEVLIQALVLSHDQENDTDILACIGSSACLAISEIPMELPVATVRVASPAFTQIPARSLSSIPPSRRWISATSISLSPAIKMAST